MWPFKPHELTQEAQEITRSLKALKTLSMRDGRVSISPHEVIDRPGYLEARAQAAGLVGKSRFMWDSHRDLWNRLDSVSLESLIARELRQSREKGLRLGDAMVALNGVLMGYGDE